MQSTCENLPISSDCVYLVIEEVYSITPKKIDLVPDWVTEGLSTDPYFGLC